MASTILSPPDVIWYMVSSKRMTPEMYFSRSGVVKSSWQRA